MRIAMLVVCLIGCPGKSQTPKPIDDTPLRIRVAQLEAQRGDGLAELIELAGSAERPTRLLALRGLGRIGGAKALATLTTAVADSDAEVSGTAATSIGLATSLDEDTAGQPAITKALLDAHAKRPDDERVLEAIGRAAEGNAQTVLALELDKGPVAAASAIALGRFGRRKIALFDATHTALLRATKHADPRVRYAVAYAFAREHLVKPEGSPAAYLADSGTALAALLKDSDPLVRAQAAQALARRKTVVAHVVALTQAAHDQDWRVAVEAVRALAGEASDPTGHRLAALVAMYWLWSIDGGVAGELWVRPLVDAAQRLDGQVTELVQAINKLADDPNRWSPNAAASGAQVVTEALQALQKHRDDPLLTALVATIGSRASNSTKLPAVTRAWIECLALTATTRAAPNPELAGMLGTGRCHLPDHLRLPLVGGLIADKVGSVDARRAALRPLLEHADPRVRVAGMTAIAAMWDDGGEPDHKAAIAMTIAALGSKDGLVAGTAVETAETLYTAIDKAKATTLAEPLDAALLARAQTEQDPELATALFGLIGKRKLGAGASACRAGVQGSPVLAKAAVECLKELGEAALLPPIAGAKPPPVEVALVIGKQVRWKLATTRGEIVIELHPDIAPWAVATIATLTRKGFYDGLELHRVVPNFVVQGGDPTQSGWGGPGFTMPAEPSTGAGYVEGGVGMADAGRDSAGSQWFVMHGPAPHLDGRYTWVGRVSSGQSAANSLLIGDKVLRATIELQNRP